MKFPPIDRESIDESTLRFLESFIWHIENVSSEIGTQDGAARHIEIALIKALHGSDDDCVVGAWRELYAEVYHILNMAAPSNGDSYRYLRTFLIENADLMESARKNESARRG